MASTEYGYYYVVHLQEFINENKPIYKVGYTNNDLADHMQCYTKGTQLLFARRVPHNLEFFIYCILLKQRFPGSPSLDMDCFEEDLDDLLNVFWGYLEAYI